jgi:putative component of toxin-antitoxin plasmid stabilization module
MYDVETTEVFDKWLTSIKDIMTRQIIVKRMQAMVSGRLG